MKILVLGCGPAGVVTALGLRALGYDVSVIGEVRPYPVTEGISARVYKALADSKLIHALGQVSEPVSRYALWNGESRSANTEYLIDRPAFDRALLADLEEHGVQLINGRVQGRPQRDEHWQVDVEHGERRSVLEADFIVEARGRAASLPRQGRMRGPETVSVGVNWRTAEKQAFSAVACVEDGWLWLARRPDGNLFTQFTTRSGRPGLSPKRKIVPLVDELLAGLHIADTDFSRREPVGEPFARSSTAILPQASTDNGVLRVGDAAMAVDPLSGNGIFQSLSSALAAPAVINTVIQRPEDAEMALSFYGDRIRHLFFRFARIGRDFYAQEGRWEDHVFWRERRQWPDKVPAHSDTDRVEEAVRPVINHGFIEQKTVIVSADQPLGLARVAGTGEGD